MLQRRRNGQSLRPGSTETWAVRTLMRLKNKHLQMRPGCCMGTWEARLMLRTL